MAHYALVDENGFVENVITGRNENDILDNNTNWELYYSNIHNPLIAIKTSYNTHGGVHYTDGEPSADQSKALRKNYAGINFTYDEARDAFIPPQPYASWVLDEATCLWEAPVAMPTDGADYTWDEQAGDWVVIPEDTVE
jgi:hypothetical protein